MTPQQLDAYPQTMRRRAAEADKRPPKDRFRRTQSDTITCPPTTLSILAILACALPACVPSSPGRRRSAVSNSEGRNHFGEAALSVELLSDGLAGVVEREELACEKKRS